MKQPQLVIATLLVASLVAACDRLGTDEEARRAAADARDAAARAGDQLADSWLTTKIQAQYFADRDVKGRFINVESQDGVVTLTGRVGDREAREQAVQIARNTDGVKEVEDLLTIGPAGNTPEEMASGWITTQIQARYFADTDIEGRDIDVTASNGVVTLSGRVDNEREKQKAIAIARDVDGVKEVQDRLMARASDEPDAVGTTGVVSDLDDAGIVTRIRAKYFLDNTLKGRDIRVETRQGVVTIGGEVSSQEERAQALLLARTTAGVERVEDHLRVTLTPEAGTADEQDQTTANAIQSALGSDPGLRAMAGLADLNIEVTAKDGVVLLNGTVPTAEAKHRAMAIAGATPGVVEVIDRLTVRNE